MGISIRVQRRAGTSHADVQPLSAEDTEFMKNIYGGHWSWQRRAIIVQLDNGRMISASMHGMPHGQGAIKGNNFNGHFCIHFRDSTTHGSHKVDLAHQLMAWKSAGILQTQIEKLDPRQIIMVFFTFINKEDLISARLLLNSRPDEQLLRQLNNIQFVTVNSLCEDNNHPFMADINLI